MTGARLNTHVSAGIALVIGEFEFIEDDVLFHPVSASVWGVRVEINSTRWNDKMRTENETKNNSNKYTITCSALAVPVYNTCS